MFPNVATITQLHDSTCLHTNGSVFAVVAVVAVDTLAAIGTHHVSAVIYRHRAVIALPA